MPLRRARGERSGPRARSAASQDNDPACCSSIDLANVSFGEPEILWLLVVPGLLLVFWTWRLLRRRARPHPPAPGADGPDPRAARAVRRSAVLAVPDRRDVAPHRRGRAPARARHRRAAGRHRPDHPAGRLVLDESRRRAGRPLAAVGAIPADARRLPELAERPHRAWRSSRGLPRRRSASRKTRTRFSSSSITSRKTRPSACRTRAPGTPTWSAASTGASGCSSATRSCTASR